MYYKLIKMLEPQRDKVSFFNRIVTMDKLFAESGAYNLMYPAPQGNPLSICWAVTNRTPEVLYHQVGLLAQFPNLFGPDDDVVFCVDKDKIADTRQIIKALDGIVRHKTVVVDRGKPGDRPCFNWDIGLDYTQHTQTLFMQDLALIGQPQELLGWARTSYDPAKLISTSIMLGPVWSRYCNKWVYLLHPRYAPNPFLICFVADRSAIQALGGFDLTFRRGFDHLGELDFLLRWVLAGNQYEISDQVELLHPGIAASQEDVQTMQFHSSITRRYFFDRWTEQFIGSLKPPFKIDNPLIEVNHALTMGELAELQTFELDATLAPTCYEFSKRPHTEYIEEVS
jgi:hypothetical protein